MVRKSTLKQTHLYSRTAKFLLMVLAAVVLAANVYILGETKKLVSSFSSQQNQATWFLFQLHKELSELVAESDHLGGTDERLSSVKLKYELVWSRFDLLTYNRESDDFMSLPGTRPFFTRLFEEFRHLEESLTDLDETDEEKVIVFSQKIRQIYSELVDYINLNFRVASPLYLEKRNQVNFLEQLQTALLLLLLVCISLIGLIFSQELKYSRRLAMTDTLTSLPNRLALFNTVEELNNLEKPFTLFLLDLNGFKEVNDKYGHQVGDDALIEVAKRLRSIETEPEHAFRIGGDEFAVLVPVCDDLCKESFCTRLESVFAHPFKFETTRYELSTSVGFATFPDDSIHIDELISYADQKMYRMKFSHKNRQNLDQNIDKNLKRPSAVNE